MRSLPARSLKARALQLLALRDYSRAEMRRRLLRWLQNQDAPPQADGDDDDGSSDGEGSAPAAQQEVEALLDALERSGLLNDERAAEALGRQRASTRGLARIRHELHTRGISGEAAQRVLGDLRATEEARARALWRKKFAQAATTPTEQARQMRFLASRGFAAELVRRIVLDGGNGDE